MLELAEFLAPLLKVGDSILLYGDIGCGKSVFARGVIHQRYRIEKAAIEDVPSPTFTIVQVYDSISPTITHVDLYRINSVEDVEILNLDREIAMPKIIFIEWPENLQTDRNVDVIIDLEHDNQARHASIECKDTNIESSIKTYYENE